MFDHNTNEYVLSLEDRIKQCRKDLDDQKMLVHHYRRQLKMVHKVATGEILESLDQEFYGMYLDYGLLYLPSDYISGDYLKLFKFDDSYALLFCDASGHGADSQAVSSKLVHFAETNYEKYIQHFKNINDSGLPYNIQVEQKVQLFSEYIKDVSLDMAHLLDIFGDEYFVSGLFLFIHKIDDAFHLFFINRGTLWPIIYRKIYDSLDKIYDYNESGNVGRAGDLIGSSFLINERRNIARKHVEKILSKQPQNLSEDVIKKLVDAEISPMTHFKIYIEDQLVFFTDGICEAVNDQNEEYGIDRIKEFFGRKDVWELPAQEAVNRFWGEHSQFTGFKPAFDDATLLLIRMKDKRTTSHLS